MEKLFVMRHLISIVDRSFHSQGFVAVRGEAIPIGFLPWENLRREYFVVSL